MYVTMDTFQGYWARCFPVYDQIRQELREGTLGEVKMVVANICLPLDKVARIRRRELGGGGLMDIGCYAVQACNAVFPGKPEKIEAQGCFFEEGRITDQWRRVLKCKIGW